MTDPYSVLGIERNATEEQIKNAYRALAEKYSADNYAGNPLADLAAGKLKDIDSAYDSIMAERRTGNARREERNRRNSYSGGTSGAAFDNAAIRNLLNQNRIDEAESRLLQVNAGSRDAEWNFLMGSVCYAKGWLDEAGRYFSTAASMEPGNREYSAAYNNMQNNRRGAARGNPYGYNTSRNAGGCSGCDICTSLMVADCCCECMGGDLIRCC